jgi:hypothetical protein
MLLIAIVGGAGWLAYNEYTGLKRRMAEADARFVEADKQLQVARGSLRAIYQVADPTQLSRSDPRLRPGWVVRVYPPPKGDDLQTPIRDVGTFVMNESRFTLLQHENHEINQPSLAAYVMNALLAADFDGVYQVGIKAEYKPPRDSQRRMTRAIPRCKVIMKVGAVMVINELITFREPNELETLITGTSHVQRGLHPVEMQLFCPLDSGVEGDQITFRMRARAPGRPTLGPDPNAFLHLVQR